MFNDIGSSVWLLRNSYSITTISMLHPPGGPPPHFRMPHLPTRETGAALRVEYMRRARPTLPGPGRGNQRG